MMAFEAARSLAHERLQHANQLSKKLTLLLDTGLALSGAAHNANLIAARQWRRRIEALFERHDVLIAPSAAGEAGLASDGTGDPVFGRAWTLLGLPCLHLPLGVGIHGLPIGLQLIGRPNGDAALLQAGAWLHPRLKD
jgi:Asp-tRNA(Asn)/Glu-tRNA(Gln) amidotransferase A subunit family amidase